MELTAKLLVLATSHFLVIHITPRYVNCDFNFNLGVPLLSSGQTKQKSTANGNGYKRNRKSYKRAYNPWLLGHGFGGPTMAWQPYFLSGQYYQQAPLQYYQRSQFQNANQQYYYPQQPPLQYYQPGQPQATANQQQFQQYFQQPTLQYSQPPIGQFQGTHTNEQQQQQELRQGQPQQQDDAYDFHYQKDKLMRNGDGTRFSNEQDFTENRNQYLQQGVKNSAHQQQQQFGSYYWSNGVPYYYYPYFIPKTQNSQVNSEQNRVNTKVNRLVASEDASAAQYEKQQNEAVDGEKIFLSKRSANH